jgi:hypothetical protein
MFYPIKFSHRQCQQEAEELRDLPAANKVLKEREHILPFFKARKHLSAFLGCYVSGIINFDLVAHELSLMGKFSCDVAVGDSRTKYYAFIEFEDARPQSIFVKKKGKQTPEWSSRFEHGFSQLVDWFFKLDDERGTAEFKALFGSEPISYEGILIVGRTQVLGPREAERLKWREQHVPIHSKKIHCLTFDQTCNELLARLEGIKLAAKAGP